MSVLRIGLISAATYGAKGQPRTPGSFHGTAFATALNGDDPALAAQHAWTFVRAGRQLAGARVAKVWDPDAEWAAHLAAVCHIPVVCPTPAACAEDVDAVIVVDDGSGEHGRYAIAALQAGLPTFIDKPIAMTAAGAKELVGLARSRGAPLLSASALRFVPDIVALREELPGLGPVQLATATCGHELVYYGIHALEMAYAVLGGGAVSCRNVGRPGRNVVRVRFERGCDLLLLVAEPEFMRPGYQITLYGRDGWRTVQPDLADLYLYLLEQFLAMVRDGRKEVVPLDEIVEVIAVLEAGKRSLIEGREVSVADLLG